MTNATCPTETALVDNAAQRAAAYVQQISSRQVTPTAEALAALDRFTGALPEEPMPPEAIVELLDRFGSPATVAVTGGRYYGFVNGGVLPAALAAEWLAAVWGQNASVRVMSPAAAVLEDTALRWVTEILGLPESCGGALVSGATLANFAGLAAARHALLERAGWDVDNDGLFGAPPLKVVVGDEVHVSLVKALGMLGLGRERVRRVPVDGHGRMLSEMLPQLDERTIVCIQAGNVNTAAFDPAREIGRRAREANAWVHVDGAFGLWAAASPRYRHLTDGFDEADSWSTDAHKWPNAGYDCGIVMVRDPRALRAAMSIASSYFTP